MTEVSIASITIGRRIRHELGDIDALAQSIADVGLLQPIVLTEDDKLIAGHRRIEAFKKLELTTIPAWRVPIDKIVLGEYAENVIRKDFDRAPDRSLVVRMEAKGLPFVVDRFLRIDSVYFHPVEWSGTMQGCEFDRDKNYRKINVKELGKKSIFLHPEEAVCYVKRGKPW